MITPEQVAFIDAVIEKYSDENRAKIAVKIQQETAELHQFVDALVKGVKS